MSVPRLPHRPKEAIPVLCDGPIAAASFAWRLQPPQDARVIVVKSTLAIAVPEGIARPLPEQDPPTGDVPYDDPPGVTAPGPKSPVPTLRYPSDFVPFKPKADVLLVGHAYPQPGSPAVASVQLVLGKLHRALAALGERVWDGVPSAPAPFARMPLRYERAFGGPGYDANPMGIGIDGTRLPNLEHPDKLLRSRGDRPAPACFAPVPAAFRARTSKLGSYDGTWLRESWPYFPKDFDWGYFNGAPPEQQLPYLRGDEPFSISGVSPTNPVVRGQLPGLSPRAYTVSTSGALREIPVRLDTVWIDADAMQMVLVWRGIVEVSAQHAPEIAALFACADRVGGSLDVAAAELRFEAKMAELHGPPAEAAKAGGSAGGAKGAAAGAAAAGAAAAAVEASATKPFAAGAVVAPPAKSRDEIVALLASGAPLDRVDLSRCDLSALDLRGRKMPGALLSGAAIDGTCFDGADLAGAVLAGAAGYQPSFRDASLRGANLAGAVLTAASFAGATLSDASLPGADASGAVFVRAVLERANLTDAVLDGAVFDGANASEADLSGASLERASWKGAVLDDVSMYGSRAAGCVFDDAKMARFRADDAKLGGASFARAQAAESSFESADLTRAVLAEATLDGSIFAHADLTGAVLNRASAKGARFRHAKLAGVAAQRANLMEANFEAADLSRADLRGASLYAAETLDAKLDGALLDGALVAASKLA